MANSDPIPPDDTHKAYQEWALGELKQVGARNFEMSKYLFGVSAGSFAVLSFLDISVSLSNYLQLIGLFLLAVSSLVALVIAEPANFTINASLNLPKEHSNYAANGKAFRYCWWIFWMFGIVCILLSSLGDISAKSDNDDGPSQQVEISF